MLEQTIFCGVKFLLTLYMHDYGMWALKIFVGKNVCGFVFKSIVWYLSFLPLQLSQASQSSFFVCIYSSLCSPLPYRCFSCIDLEVKFVSVTC